MTQPKIMTKIDQHLNKAGWVHGLLVGNAMAAFFTGYLTTGIIFVIFALIISVILIMEDR